MKGQIQNRKEVIPVSEYRKKFKTAFHNENVDLRDYEKEIVDTIEKIAPGKHPKVFKDYYSTDDLTQSEAVKIGRELAVHEHADYKNISTITDVITGCRFCDIKKEVKKVTKEDIKEALEEFIKHYTLDEIKKTCIIKEEKLGETKK